MTDDELLAEMGRQPARNAALDARVRVALRALVRGDHATYLTLLRYSMMDSDALQLLISRDRIYCTDILACQGRELTERRLEQDIAFGREQALEGELYD